jgi:hypothetical protein
MLTGHEKNEVYEEHPVLLQRHFALGHKHLCGIQFFFSESLSFLIRVRLREAQPKRYNEHGRPSAEPEQRAPFMAHGVDESAGKDSREQVSKSIALL